LNEQKQKKAQQRKIFEGGGGEGGQIGCATADVQVAYIFLKFAFQGKSE